jgi:hypothetical protein
MFDENSCFVQEMIKSHYNMGKLVYKHTNDHKATLLKMSELAVSYIISMCSLAYKLEGLGIKEEELCNLIGENKEFVLPMLELYKKHRKELN